MSSHFLRPDQRPSSQLIAEDPASALPSARVPPGQPQGTSLVSALVNPSHGGRWQDLPWGSSISHWSSLRIIFISRFNKKKNSMFPYTLLSDLDYLVSVSALMICAAQGSRWAPNSGNVPETWASTWALRAPLLSERWPVGRAVSVSPCREPLAGGDLQRKVCPSPPVWVAGPQVEGRVLAPTPFPHRSLGVQTSLWGRRCAPRSSCHLAGRDPPPPAAEPRPFSTDSFFGHGAHGPGRASTRAVGAGGPEAAFERTLH